MIERQDGAAAAHGGMDWLLATMNGMLRCHTVSDLLDLAYDAIREGLGYDRVGLDMVDPERHALVEYIGTDADGRKFFPENRVFPLDEGALYTRMLADPRLQVTGPGFIYVANATQAMPPEMLAILDGRPTENLIVSLRTAEQILGLMYVDNLISGRPFSAADAPPLVTFATALAMAVENATLLQHNAARITGLTASLEQRIGELEWLRERERIERTRLEVLLESARALNSTLDSDQILHLMAVRLVSALDAASAAFTQVDLTARRCNTLAQHTTHGRAPLFGSEEQTTLDRYPAIERVLAARTPLHRYVDDPGFVESERAFLHEHDLHAELLIPVIAHGDATNILGVHWDRHVVITPDMVALCTTIAEQTALALENARLYAQAAARAEQDALTGLLNHRAVLQRLDAALEKGIHCALLLIDVDNFKLFNDTHGHLTGDAVLMLVAGTLRDICREDDVAGRYGGDEFALLLHNVAADDAMAVARRLAATVQTRTHTMPDGTIIPLSISVGWAGYPTDGYTRQELVAVADRTMYEAKRRAGSRLALDFAHTGYAPWPDTYLRDATDVLGNSPFGVLEGLVTAVDAKDRYTREHSDDVTQLALLIAETLDLTEEERRVLTVAGLLHDVGKVAVPDRILRKPGKLTTEEYRVIKGHVSYGVAFIRGMLDDPAVLDAVAYHHERWDGEGYPYGLSGADTPLLGRIMQIADAVSAMMLDRPYRQGLPWRRVVSELRKGTGTQFDPTLVDAFIATVTRRDTAAS